MKDFRQRPPFGDARPDALVELTERRLDGRQRVHGEDVGEWRMKLLADRLRRMERQGLVARVRYSKRPPRAAYALTDRGRGLGLVVGALAVWGRPLVGPRSGPRHATCGHPIEVQQYCPRCEERVAPATVHVPAATAPTARRRNRRRTPLGLRP